MTLTTSVDALKTFILQKTIRISKLECFVPGNKVLTSLIFEGETGAYLSGAGLGYHMR
jgi:hypothetical protein